MNFPLTIRAQLPRGDMHLQITHSDVPPDALFALGARDNPKRGFLFVSHVLGKHLAVDPKSMQNTHEQLAAKIPYHPGPVAFIGMAETATCLGQGVFEAWSKRYPDVETVYLHTTRYQVAEHQPVPFQESHSHAPDIWLYPCQATEHAQRFAQAKSLVIVDDELSTGNTLVNLVQACVAMAPQVEHVHFCCLTNFVSTATQAVLQQQVSPKQLQLHALLHGQWSYQEHTQVLPKHNSAQHKQAAQVVDQGYGRLGCHTLLSFTPEQMSAFTQGIDAQSNVLVLGTGEFMYPAFVFARQLQAITGAPVKMHATTRSPVLPWGPIQQVMQFEDNYAEGVINYLYNYDKNQYQHVFLCFETEPNAALMHLGRMINALGVKFVAESRLEKVSFY